MKCTLILMPIIKETASLHAKPAKTQTAFIGSIFSEERKPPFWCADVQFILLRIPRYSKYIKFMYLVRLMWRSASESKPVHSRYSRLSQVWRTAEPIRIKSAVSNWFRRRTSHELRPGSDAVLHMSRIAFNELSSCEVRRLRPGSDAVLHMSRIKFEFRPTQINLDQLNWFRRRS